MYDHHPTTPKKKPQSDPVRIIIATGWVLFTLSITILYFTYLIRTLPPPEPIHPIPHPNTIYAGW